jgi:hypothetical protein
LAEHNGKQGERIRYYCEYTNSTEIDHIGTDTLARLSCLKKETFGSSFNNTLYVIIPSQIIADDNPQHFGITYDFKFFMIYGQGMTRIFHLKQPFTIFSHKN